jgi:hypothetical protein
MQHPPIVSRHDIAGVWKRVFLVDGDGVEDRESAVFWIQATRLCADIRQHRRLTLLVDAAGAEELPLLDAFAGELIEGDGTFCWRPSLQLRHRDGPPDEGRLSWDGANLREDGVHLSYTEGWTRIAAAVDGDYAVSLRHPETDRTAYLLHIGPFVFHARGGPADEAAFTLFELSGTAPRIVLSSHAAPEASVPVLSFADDARRTAWISDPRDGDGSRPWLVTAHDECAAAGR